MNADLTPIGAQARALLARAEAYDTTGGAFSLDDAMTGHLGAVCNRAGRVIFAWTMDLHTDRLGVQAYVTAAAGERIADMLEHIEHKARELGANRLAFRTKRRGLVKTMSGLGFGQVAVEMEKTL